MISRLLVVLQFALLAALVAPPHAAMAPVAALVLAGLALALGGAALFANRPGNFNIRPDPKPGGALIIQGPYRHVRHPMYVAVMLFAAACVAWEPAPWRIVAALALALVLHAKAVREERAMAAKHPQYLAYAMRTGRYLPRLR